MTRRAKPPEQHTAPRFTGVLQIISDVGWEHAAMESGNAGTTIPPCSLPYVLRTNVTTRWTRPTRDVKAQCRKVLKCPTCEKGMHTAQAMVLMGLAIQRVTFDPERTGEFNSEPCARCNGEGAIPLPEMSQSGDFKDVPCPDCND